jgi:hypothetical protein
MRRPVGSNARFSECWIARGSVRGRDKGVKSALRNHRRHRPTTSRTRVPARRRGVRKRAKSARWRTPQEGGRSGSGTQAPQPGHRESGGCVRRGQTNRWTTLNLPRSRPGSADSLRRRRPQLGDKWHMDEVFIRITRSGLIAPASHRLVGDGDTALSQDQLDIAQAEAEYVV